MAKRVVLGVAVLVLLAIVAWRSVVIVDETEVAVLTRWGVIEGTLAPGLHTKAPWDEAHLLDRRLLTRAFPGESFLTDDRRVLNVDFYVKWRLDDAERYMRATHGDEDVAAQRLGELARAQIRELMRHMPAGAISLDMGDAAAAPGSSVLHAQAAMLGVRLVDLQLQRIDVSDDAAQAVYQRMQQSLMAQIEQLHSTASSEADKIRADADRQRADALANATRDAQRLRGDADAKAAAAYAQAYAHNPEFATFYRSLQAYKQTLGQAGDILVISPEGEFFKYLHSAGGH